jgi:ornithine cyclodeaminase/alanine dehydrogenase-like protein (mu-crystallin family)
MMILNNEEISAVLTMENCLRFLEKAYKEQAQGTAINRPRSDMYLPATTHGGVYCFKTMEGALSQEKVVALRLNSDVIRWEERGRADHQRQNTGGAG